MAVSQTVPARAQEPLDALVWRELGLGAPAVQAVLEANPGLAAQGPFLLDGTRVVLPAAASAPAPAPLIQLWD